MSVAAAVLYGLGVVMLFGLRSWQHMRATGSYGFNGFTAGRGPAARVAGVCFAAAVLAGLTSPVLAATGVLTTGVLTTGSAASALASVVTWLGTLLAVAGFVDPSERTELVTRGVFAAARNPIFTAMIIAQTGTTLMAPTWLALAGLALLIFGIELQVRHVEEPYLLEVHGNADTNYAARTGRFLPGRGLLTTSAPDQPLTVRRLG